MGNAAFHEGKIHLVVEHILFDHFRIFDRDTDGNIGMGAPVSLHKGREQAVAEGDAGADVQGRVVFPAGDAAFHFGKKRNDMEGVVIKFISDLRRIDAAGNAVEKAHMIKVLQLPQGEADGGLRKMQPVGGLCNAVLLIDGDEYFHMAQGHGNLLWALYGKERRRYIIKRLYIL